MSADDQSSGGIDTRHWPKDVRQLTFDEGDKLGVRDTDNALFWDGKEIQTRQVVSLRWIELALACLAAVGTFGVFALEFARFMGWEK
jgi:hypothetical protein